MSAFDSFPALDAQTLSAWRQAIDSGFRAFSREHGQLLDRLAEPLRALLLGSERLFTQAPWPLVLLAVALLAWLAARSWRLVLGCTGTLVLIGVFGLWQDAMQTLSITLASTGVALLLGLPIGMAMSRSDRLQRAVNPLLDLMQTLPSFVYLIPVVMLLGIGRVAGLIAVVTYAIPPVIRFTNLGLRLVDAELIEAAEAFGSTPWQRLRQVQLPLALPTIMAGVNQTVLMSLAMVVIASMIGVPGLGQPVLKAISNQYFTLGLLNGLAIVGIAVVLDRLLQASSRRLQKHRALHDG